jgi:hypothetical protein
MSFGSDETVLRDLTGVVQRVRGLQVGAWFVFESPAAATVVSRTRGWHRPARAWSVLLVKDHALITFSDLATALAVADEASLRLPEDRRQWTRTDCDWLNACYEADRCIPRATFDASRDFAGATGTA